MDQGFPNRWKRWGKGIFAGGGGGGGFIGLWEFKDELFWQIKPLSKLKPSSCKYWTSIKSKISMATCVQMKIK